MRLLMLIVALLLGCGDDAGGGDELTGGGQGGAGGATDAGLDGSPGAPNDAGSDAAVSIACEDSLDCPIGKVCDAQARKCVECMRASDCEAEHVCVDRECRQACDSDLDCQPLRMLCDHEAGHCVRELVRADAGTDSAVECSGAHVFEVARVPPTVMLVVDGSTSMLDPYGEPVLLDGGVPDPQLLPSRWDALRDALVDPTGGLVPALAGVVRFGLGVFGTAPECPLPLGIIEPVIDNSVAIADGLPAEPPGMYTPTGIALDSIIDALPDSAVEPGRGKQIIVLATDGDPNSCEAEPDIFMGGQVPADYASSLAAATKASAKHIELIVISVGRDASVAHLQQVANLGAGLPQDATPGARVYVPEDAAELTSELRTLVEAQLGCDLHLDLEGRTVLADEACSGQLKINGTIIPCGTANGWSFEAPSTIRLATEACALLSGSSASVVASFPCGALAR